MRLRVFTRRSWLLSGSQFFGVIEMHRSRPLDPYHFAAVAMGVLLVLGGLTIALGLLRLAIPIWVTYLALTGATLYMRSDYHQRSRLEWAAADVLERCGKQLLVVFFLLCAITYAINS